LKRRHPKTEFDFLQKKLARVSVQHSQLIASTESVRDTQRKNWDFLIALERENALSIYKQNDRKDALVTLHNRGTNKLVVVSLPVSVVVVVVVVS